MEGCAVAGNGRDLDVNLPSIARMYDYMLGGKDNFSADRAATERLAELMPEVRDLALANRRFLVRAVRHIAGQGVDQFIDIGTGVPTSPNVHEIAREIHPAARVVYVDNDPIVAAHNQALRAADGVLAVSADARDTGSVLENPAVRRLIDFDRPVGVLFIASIHYLGDDDRVRPMLERYRDAVAPGSYFAASITASNWDMSEVTARQLMSVFANSATPMTARSPDEIAALMVDVELDEPGLVPVTKWRTGEPDVSVPVLAAVGRYRK